MFCTDTHSRAHGYSPPRRSYPGPYSITRRAPPDPHTFDYPATLKQYAEWFRYYYPQQAIDEDNADKAAEQEAGDGSKPRNGIKARWEKYKKDFAATQVSTALFLVREWVSQLAIIISLAVYTATESSLVMCCSYRRCLIITENPLGLRKNTTHHQTS